MSKRPAAKRKVMVVTGSRSEFGLLQPVMAAVKKHKGLTLQVVAAGEHLLAPANTWREVEAAFGIDAKVPMQKKTDKGRADHAAACGRGMEGFARVIRKLKPDWVVVLGDRVEAFAAASAASIAGVAVCHIHGGDSAEGIADEAMRHAITKLAHLHCAATKRSAERIVKMGEPVSTVHVTGSPAIDALDRVRPMSRAKARELGNPTSIILLHPSGFGENDDELRAIQVVAAALLVSRPLFLLPNSDPGHKGILRVRADEMKNQARRDQLKVTVNDGVAFADHLPRHEFLALLAMIARHPDGAVFGNSSAALIECAALGVPAFNFGPRQGGRERASNVFDVQEITDPSHLASWMVSTRLDLSSHMSEVRKGGRVTHPYGDGRAGPRIADLLVKTDPHAPALLRKRIAY